MSGVKVSVVIPTHAPRYPVLREVLEALRNQEGGRADEVLVGVDQDPPEWAEDFPEVRWIRSDRPSPAAKRNRCLEAARGDIVLFLDDDVIPDPRVITAHRAGHARFPEERVVLLGEVVWPESVRETALGWWVEWGHAYFDYRRWRPGQRLPLYAFYTAHVSGKRTFLLQARFDENYTDLAYEDADYGFHLPGAVLLFWPEARGYHKKFLTWQDMASRARARGRMRPYFLHRNPHRRRKGEDLLFRSTRLLRYLQKLDPLAQRLSRWPRFAGPFCQAVFGATFLGHLADGLAQALQEARTSPTFPPLPHPLPPSR